MNRTSKGIKCNKCERQVFNRSYKFCPWCGKKFIPPKVTGTKDPPPFIFETKKRCEPMRMRE